MPVFLRKEITQPWQCKSSLFSLTLRLDLLKLLYSQLLEECVKISEGLPEIEGVRHLARASNKLSKVFEAVGKERESAEYLDRALTLKEEIYKLDGESPHGITDFEILVPWMLW